MTFEHLKFRYTQLSYVVCATVLAFLVLNVGLGAVFGVREYHYYRLHQSERADVLRPRPGQPKITPERTDYQLKWLDTRGFSPGELGRLDQVLTDFFQHEKHGYRFSPFVHYSTVPFRSTNLNVFETLGFDHRLVPNATSKKRKIFLFGGSTTFGTHVADDWTFAAYLQKLMPTYEVFNFGRANYSWYQEMVLFQRLVHAGMVPTVAVFMDGVNVFSQDGAPVWTDKMRALWERAQILPDQSMFPPQIPLFRLINAISLRRRNALLKDRMKDRVPASAPNLSFRQSYLNTLEQLRALGKELDVKMIFALQPNRVVGCDHGQYGREIDQNYAKTIQEFYDSMKGYGRADYHDLSGLCDQFDRSRIAFVDDVHYSPAFNLIIAQQLANVIARAQ